MKKVIIIVIVVLFLGVAVAPGLGYQHRMESTGITFNTELFWMVNPCMVTVGAVTCMTVAWK
jgi:hypothetical protein